MLLKNTSSYSRRGKRPIFQKVSRSHDICSCFHKSRPVLRESFRSFTCSTQVIPTVLALVLGYQLGAKHRRTQLQADAEEGHADGL